MDGSRATFPDAILASRIERLELEERDAIRRRDWSAARNVAIERTTLKEAHHRTVARRRKA